MIVIRHRTNTIEELLSVPQHFGVEIDIRSWANELILEHDAFKAGVPLREWLKEFAHDFLIANVKEDGIEARVSEVFTEAGVKNYFFLDMTMPTLLRKAKKHEGRVAVRVSKYESVENALKLAKLCKWVWIDHLESALPTHQELLRLKDAGFKICLVSPELVFGVDHDISDFMGILAETRFVPDAICSKFPERWADWHRSVLSNIDKFEVQTDHQMKSRP